MQFEDAKNLRESWGNKPCNHPKLVKEYHLGMDTMDFVCNTCGASFTKEEKEQLEKQGPDF